MAVTPCDVCAARLHLHLHPDRVPACAGATKVCIDCEQHMCESACDHHHAFGGNAGHTCMSIADHTAAGLAGVSILCAEHASQSARDLKRYSLYSTTEEKPVCVICCLQKNSDKRISLSDKRNQLQPLQDTNIQHCQTRLGAMDLAVKQTEKAAARIEGTHAEAQQQLDRFQQEVRLAAPAGSPGRRLAALGCESTLRGSRTCNTFVLALACAAARAGGGAHFGAQGQAGGGPKHGGIASLDAVRGVHALLQHDS
jgi:hypothetical protein